MDPLYRRAPTPHELVLAPMGKWVRFLTNAPVILSILERAYGHWHDLDPRYAGGEPLTIRLIVHDIEDSASAHPVYRMPEDGHLLVSGRGSLGWADRRSGQAVCYVSPGALRDEGWARYNLIQALLVFVLTPRDRCPLHAAAIVRDGVAILLTGPPGVGKSTLAHAAAAEGYRVLADDAVFIQQDPIVRVWGLSAELRLSTGPPGRGAPHRSAAKRVVDLRAASLLAWPPFAERAVLCVLDRSVTVPDVRRLGRADVIARVREQMPTGFDLFADQLPTALAALVNEGWRLQLPERPADAVPYLNALVAET